jgi:O-antigen/teichoic acid export membrane protein
MLRQLASVFVNHILLYALGLVGAVLIARLLGPEGRGLVVMAVVTANLGMCLCQLGLPQALNYHLSRAPDRRAELGHALGVGARLAPFLLGITVLFYGSAFLFARSSVLQGLTPGLVLASFVLSLMVTGQETLARTLVGLEDYRTRNLLLLCQPVLLLLALVAFWVSGTPLTPLAVTWLYVSAVAVGLVLGGARLGRAYRPSLDLAVPPDWKKTYLGYGLKFYPSLIINVLNYRADTFVVNALLGTEAVGLYDTGVRVTELLLFFPHTVNWVFFTRVASAEGGRQHALTAMTLGASLYLVLAGAVVLAVLIPFGIPLFFGANFAPAVAPALWLLPGIVVLTAVKILANAVAGCGRPEYATCTTLVGLAGMLALDFVLIPPFGIVGAAWASVVGYSLWAAALVALYLRLVRVSAGKLLADAVVEPVAWLRHDGWRKLSAALRPVPEAAKTGP